MPPMTNQSMLLPSFLRDTNFTGFPELRAPPLKYEILSDTNTTTVGPIVTTTPETISTANTQHTSLQSTPIPTVPLNQSLSSNSSLGLSFTTPPVTETLNNTTQSVNTEVIQSALTDQTPEQNTSLPESSSFTSLRTTASPDQVQSHNASQTATPNTAQTTGRTATVVTTTAPDTTTALKDGTTFQNTAVVPDAATPHSTTETPSVSRVPTIRYDATTLAPVGLNTTAPPQSFSTVGNHTLPATMRKKATQTLWNTTVLPTGINTTGIPGNGTVPVAMVTIVATDNHTLHSLESSLPSNATTVDATTRPTSLDGRTANHSTSILPNETTTGSVVMATDRETPSTDPTTTAARDPQTYNWTETNTNRTVNMTFGVTMTQTSANPPNPSTTSVVSIDTITTSTIPPVQSPLATTTSSMTGSDQHSKNQSIHTPETAIPTNHTVATVTESLPLDTTVTNQSNMSASTTGNISLGATETSEHTRGQEEEAKELEIQSQKVSKLNSSQVEELVGRLERLLDGASVPLVVGRIAVRAISNLMEGHHLAISSSTNRLIHSVDQLALKLEVGAETLVLSASSLALAVRPLDGSRFPETSLSLTDPAHLQVSTADRSLPQRSEVDLASVYLPSSLLESLTPAERALATRVQFTFYTTPKLFQDVALGNGTLVSPVLGSSVTNLSISNLRENIQFSICSPHSTQANALPQCVFWDFRLNGGRGGWSPEGCSVLNVTDGKTTCSCNHLTSFAVLLDLSRRGVSDRQHGAILTFITYIGCGVSAVFLSITLLTYMCFRKLLRDIPSKILVQLCLSLLLLNLVFLLDGWLALYPAPGLCISTAFFLHYFLLTSFTWAGLEALHMYLSIVRVFTPYLSRYMLRFSLMGWGIPMTVVVVIISVDKDNYGLITYGKYSDGTTDDFCWLRNNIAFYIGVVAYFLVVFLLCLVVFTVVLAQLARIKRQNPHHQCPRRSLVTDLRSVAGLILLLGLTWGFALFAWGPLHLPFIYLFSIFNSLQGFFIFLFHCAVKENVRRQWRTYLCCGRLRLAENSEWSRTATQNPKKQSIAVITNVALSPASRSSSLSSEMTNSFGSDSGISDSYNGDVVLNEIHLRNMAALS
ncbi:adhesion G-protein coupled receptor G2 [Gadus macrocephalus]|uniref:adhesion G-protein coupled receptor G2 n=1 Tax=Gadus macrocephalus TaxID=80720 RepID=UPI0028CBA8B6|nr:adhesion G-protein coupled receptor G2 [Gadus macrocephalus]